MLFGFLMFWPHRTSEVSLIPSCCRQKLLSWNILTLLVTGHGRLPNAGDLFQCFMTKAVRLLLIGPWTEICRDPWNLLLFFWRVLGKYCSSSPWRCALPWDWCGNRWQNYFGPMARSWPALDNFSSNIASTLRVLTVGVKAGLDQDVRALIPGAFPVFFCIKLRRLAQKGSHSWGTAFFL